MGRSVSAAAAVPPGEPFYHAASDRHYEIVEHSGKWGVRRYQTGSEGEQTNIVEKSIDYVVGSGNHARTYVHQSEDGTLLELPLSWYAEQGGYWAMSPGYDRPDHDGFRRRVGEQCLFCHTAYPTARDAPPAAIDCQRCHGPGLEHVNKARVSAAPEEIRSAVVNPARLSPQRRLEVCLQCHLETTSRPLPNAIRRFDRQPFSYQPGEPLSGYILHFDHAAGSGRDDKFEVNHAGYRFLQSQCYLESKGALDCTSCHDPHRALRGADAAAHYRQLCRSCHSGLSAASHPAGEDCIACHMPKRRSEDAVHVLMTDHRIARALPSRDPAAPLDELKLAKQAAYTGEVALYPIPDGPGEKAAQLYLALAQVKDLANLRPGVARLAQAVADVEPPQAEFYFELGAAHMKMGALPEAAQAYREAIRRRQSWAAPYVRLAEVLLRAGKPDEAIAVLKDAPEPEDGEAAMTLGVALGQLGRLDGSVQALERAVKAMADHPMAWLNLGVSLEQSGDFRRAESCYREAIRVRPDFEPARRHLANLLAAVEEGGRR
jgi:predicted CXXCH cytochrome family protein